MFAAWVKMERKDKKKREIRKKKNKKPYLPERFVDFPGTSTIISSMGSGHPNPNATALDLPSQKEIIVSRKSVIVKNHL